MAEILIKANIAEGDTIYVGFNAAKSEIKIKLKKFKDLNDVLPEHDHDPDPDTGKESAENTD